MKYPKVNFRLFIPQSDGPLIAQWVVERDYETYFRNCATLPSLNECFDYPNWSQNLTMMVMSDEGENSKTIGMVSAYHANYRNRSIKAGALIDKNFQNQGYGHSAQVQWIDFLFKRVNFRKVIVENVHEYLTGPYLKIGFSQEGRYIAETCIDGEWKDEVRLACFSDDWIGVEKALQM